MTLPRATSAEPGGEPSSWTVPSDGVATRLVAEMVAAWGHGDRTPAEVYLARLADASDDPETAIRVIYEEVCLRHDEGQHVPPSELVRRFPRWQAELEVLLECDRLLDSEPAPVFPAAGEALGDFRLLLELGRGTRGRCFLAEQPSLASRRVVLKLTPIDHEEHLSLACLQHTHIAPLYSEQAFPARNLRALCMPYLGGGTLGQVLAHLDRVPIGERTGRSFLDVLDRFPLAPMTVAASPARQFLQRVSYERAVCWIGACLADALQYAHDRGLVHMDVKPSNVLLAADGQPLLLDFHLAHAPLHAGDARPEWLGGTPGYMSPEQEAAVLAASAGRAIPADVGPRSDVYALGRVLCEALCGTIVPSVHGAAVRHPPEVSASLRALVRRCLEPDLGKRYSDAAAVADDLRRHMADLPLMGVASRGFRERWSKWCRRRPSALLRLKALATMSVAALALVFAVWTAFLVPRFRAAEHALADARLLLNRRDYPGALRVLTRGAALIEGLPGGESLTRELAAQLGTANRARDAERLHDLVDTLRFLDSAAGRPDVAAEAVARDCRVAWESRRSIVEQLGAGLEPEAAARLRADLLDLAIIGASLRVRLATGREPVSAARRNALRVLDEAEASLGPSHVLFRERQAHASALGLFDVAAAAARGAEHVAARSASEHYAVGRSLLVAGDLVQAELAFDRAVALRPQDFWPNFYQGACAYRSGHFNAAANAFRVCIALAPDRAEYYFNRALAHAALGLTDDAFLDYDRAVQLDRCLPAPPSARKRPENRSRQYDSMTQPSK